MTTACIIVLYKPNNELLVDVFRAIETQVENIVLVDNSPEQTICPQGKYHYISMGKNCGIAAAQNAGLKYLINDSTADYVLFLDQDSIVSQNIVEQLMLVYCTLLKQNIAVGGIVARAINRQNGKDYRQKKIGKFHQDNVYEVREIMSSSAMIAIENFKIVGVMDSSLFIDGVDWEWCWRAKAKHKLRFFICTNVILNHCLGQGDRSFAGINIAISSPFRIYYQYRNFLWLCARSYVPMAWKFQQGIQYMAKLIYYSLLISPQKKYRRMILLGIKNGLRPNKNQY